MVGRENRGEEMSKAHITFPCGNLKLEGIFYTTVSDKLLPSVVVCHPHSLHGGSMNNNVTLAIADALLSIKVNTLLFNFRGVGTSQGNFGGGLEEQNDVRAALDWLEKQYGVDTDRLALAGYSFGAGVAFPVACADERVKAIAMVSPYFEVNLNNLLNSCTKPKLFVTGTDDRIVLPDDVAGYATVSAEPKKAFFINGVDHFWANYEKEMASTVVQFFEDLFP
jgi:uncharacterized protein